MRSSMCIQKIPQKILHVEAVARKSDLEQCITSAVLGPRTHETLQFKRPQLQQRAVPERDF